MMAVLCSAAGADAEPRKLTREEQKLAQALFDRGEAAALRKEYQAALTAFLAAYDVTLEPVALFSIAQCHRLLDQKEEALLGYQRFLEELSEEDRKSPEIEPLVTYAEEFIVELTAALTESAPEPENTFEPESAPASQPEVAPPSAQSEALRDQLFPAGIRLAPRQPTLLYGGAATSAALGLTSGIIALTSAASAKELAANIPNDGSPQEQAQIDKADRLATRARILGLTSDILLATAAVTGSLGYWLGKRAQKGNVRFSLAPSSAGSGLALTVRY